MKKVLLSVGVSIASLVCSTALAMSVGVVDTQEIYNSPQGMKEIQTKLQDKFSSQHNDMVNMMKDIQAEQKNYEKNKTVWDKSKAQKMEADIEQKKSNFQMTQAKFQQAYVNAQQEALKDFLVKVRTAVKSIATKDNLDMVFDQNSALYVKDSKDITNSVMGEMK